MDKLEIKKKVIEEIAKQIGLWDYEGKVVSLESRISSGSNLYDDVGMDDIDAVEVTISLEEEFKIDIPDDEAQKWKTVKDIVDYLVKKGM